MSLTSNELIFLAAAAIYAQRRIADADENAREKAMEDAVELFKLIDEKYPLPFINKS